MDCALQIKKGGNYLIVCCWYILVIIHERQMRFSVFDDAKNGFQNKIFEYIKMKVSTGDKYFTKLNQNKPLK